ncbi:hypothetical protein GCM10027577_25700 [Spirosoma fluminis]
MTFHPRWEDKNNPKSTWTNHVKYKDLQEWLNIFNAKYKLNYVLYENSIRAFTEKNTNKYNVGDIKYNTDVLTFKPNTEIDYIKVGNPEFMEIFLYRRAMYNQLDSSYTFKDVLQACNYYISKYPNGNPKYKNDIVKRINYINAIPELARQDTINQQILNRSKALALRQQKEKQDAKLAEQRKAEIVMFVTTARHVKDIALQRASFRKLMSDRELYSNSAASYGIPWVDRIMDESGKRYGKVSFKIENIHTDLITTSKEKYDYSPESGEDNPFRSLVVTSVSKTSDSFHKISFYCNDSLITTLDGTSTLGFSSDYKNNEFSHGKSSVAIIAHGSPNPNDILDKVKNLACIYRTKSEIDSLKRSSERYFNKAIEEIKNDRHRYGVIFIDSAANIYGGESKYYLERANALKYLDQPYLSNKDYDEERRAKILKGESSGRELRNLKIEAIKPTY